MTEKGEDTLRRQAESRLRLPTDVEGLSAGDARRLVHELRVHQIELEMQNEELRRAQEELEAARDRYLHLYDFAPNGYLTIDQRDRVREANLTAASVFELERSSLRGMPFSRLVHKESQDSYYLHRTHVLATRTRHTCELELVRGGGATFYAQLESLAVENEDGRGNQWRTHITDVTERKRAERVLFDEKERAQVTLQAIGDAVITTDAEGVVDYLNPVAEELTGWSLAEARGQPVARIFEIVNEQTREPALDPVAGCMQQDKIVGIAKHSLLISRCGHEYAVQDSAAPIRCRSGKVVGAVLVFQDVTRSRRMAREMAHQASHDALTNLVNRREFEHRLRRVLEAARDEQSEHALCYLDLDEFKIINDTCGHVAGDELLRQVGNVLQEHVRKSDTLARLGGDEFGVVMEHCSLKQATRVADTLRQAIEDIRFLWENKRFSIAVSIGLVPITEASEGISGVLRAADGACYAAKDAGRNRVHVYHEADAQLAQRHGEMQWVTRIPRALEENRFHLDCQPIAPVAGLDGNRGHHYELLLRLENEEGQIVLPKAFLPAAERHSLAPKIDRWVVRTALEYLAREPGCVERLFLCAINLSGHSLASKDFLEFVIRQLEETSVPPEKLCFEITETAAIANLAHASRFIKTLEERGCLFALDDFGSGLSSFAYLKNLPVHFLKIDGAFVRGIVENAMDLAMVSCIHQVARVMGKQTIAEFVENEAILGKLREIGVDYAQGYAVGRPEPIV